MSQKIHFKLLFILLALITYGCVETFDFKSEIENFDSVLVVEATITNEITTQKIMLSRSYNLDSLGPVAESNAQVKVIDNASNEFVFNEQESGEYLSNVEFAAEIDKEYTLLIETSDGKQYSSAPSKLKTATTKIDNLYLERDFNDKNEEGMFVLIDTYDPSGESQYYRYEYEETYKIVAPLYSPYDIVFPEIPLGIVWTVELLNYYYGTYEIVLNPEQEQICYNTEKSKKIILANTDDLEEDRLTAFEVRFINRFNYILAQRYSILVKQYTQTEEAFRFYKNLDKISGTESLLSQIQPGVVIGNVSSVKNKKETVLGFFQVAAVDSKRIYFNYEDYFPESEERPFVINCGSSSVFIAPEAISYNGGPYPLFDHIKEGYQYYTENTGAFGDIGAGSAVIVPPPCGDCTVLGKTEVPDFWVD